MEIFDLILKYKEALLKGLYTTLYLSFMIWFIGIIAGTIIGIFSGKNNRVLSMVAKFLSTLISGVPILVLLYWMYYPMQQILNIEFDPMNIAIIAFSFVNTFMVADVVRQGIASLPKHYTTTAIVSGLSKKTIFLKIQFPLIFRSLIGPILFIQITMLHNSIFASLINVDDIFRQIQRINALEYKPIELYSILALFFLIITSIGLITTFIKVSKIKNLMFIIRKNTQVAFVLLVLSTTINWDKIITFYNINNAEQLDLSYLIALKNNNTFLLKDYVEKNKTSINNEMNINKKHSDYIEELNENSWQEMVYDNLKIK